VRSVLLEGLPTRSVGFSVHNVHHWSPLLRLTCAVRSGLLEGFASDPRQPFNVIGRSHTAGRRQRNNRWAVSRVKATPTGPSRPASPWWSPRSTCHLYMHAPCIVVYMLLNYARAKPSSSSPPFHACQPPFQHLAIFLAGVIVSSGAIVSACHQAAWNRFWYHSNLCIF
jgi:hypothetical protein